MERLADGPEGHGRLSRRRILQGGAIGVGAILGGGVVYALTNAPSTEEAGTRAGERPPRFSDRPSWAQEFDRMPTAAIDTAVWRHETSPDAAGFNAELQAYTSRAENARVEPGLGLVLEAHRREYRYPDDPEGRRFDYTSGRVDTRDSLFFEYGKVEARLRMPKGPGVWPAFWLLSANEPHTSGRAFTDEQLGDERFHLRNGEIDIVEYYGRRPGEVEATVHTFAASRAGTVDVPDATDAFHTYGIELTPRSIVWTVDQEPYFRYGKPSDDPEEWPFGGTNELYLILNLALGGPYGGPAQDDPGPWRFEVQNVRFYRYTGA